ncbi:hypothetical protein POTOM_023764 [Populus tomentosa]|uniref:Uncharacterized protein n=1 Tax=Populus tomentosa TaxID=118781 RepID=A0A8X8CZC1_POPTO|nr:hypothetical protein POTOM_023764 [Populus tomentosa]
MNKKLGRYEKSGSLGTKSQGDKGATWHRDFEISFRMLWNDRWLADDLSSFDDGELSESEDWLFEFLDTLEVLLAERRVDEVMEALEKGERLANELADTISQPSTRGLELRSAVLALNFFGDVPVPIYCYSILTSRSCSLVCRVFAHQTVHVEEAYTAALSQIVFSTIIQAASDSLEVYGEELAYTSKLVTWAVKEIESFAFLLKRHVLAQSAAARRLRVATKWIHICLGHCSLSEARGLSLATILLRLFRSIIEQALNANLKKNEESSAALAAADDWLLTYPPAGGSPFSQTASLAENEESLEGSGSRIVKMEGNESQQLALLASALLLEDELLPCSAMKLLPFPARMDEQPKRASERQSRLPEQRQKEEEASTLS